MGFRFRKYFGVLPGIRVNVGKKRVSLSVGVRGLTANISKDGIRTTISAPGTGLSYSSYQERTEEMAPGKEMSPLVLWAIIFAILAIAGGIVSLIIMMT
jgi:hypothetical protein